jgi:putative chitobiose transport system substrate-binding protein
MKRNIIIGILTCLAALIFFLSSNQKNNEVVFWTLQMGDFAPYINGVIAEFEASYPHIKIKWVDIPFSEGEKRTLASVLSNNPPDLVNLNPDFSAILAQKGALWEIDEIHAQDFKPDIIETLKYDGKLYSLPWYATSAVTIYNRDLLEKSGVRGVPATYEELAALSPAIRKSGVYPFLPNITENDTMVKVLNKYGAADKLNSPEAVRVFEMFRQLYKDDLIPKETVTQTQREALEKYMAGQIVFLQAGGNFLNIIRENAPDVYAKTDVAPQITGSRGQNDFSLMNFVIPLRAHHKKEALQFLIFLTNDKNQLELAHLTNVLATNKKTLQDSFFTEYEEYDLMAKARVISARQLEHITPAFTPNRAQKEINTLVNTAVQEILLNNADIQETLDKLEIERSKL